MFHNCKGSLQGRLAAASRIHKCLTGRDLLNKNEEILIALFTGREKYRVRPAGDTLLSNREDSGFHFRP